MLNVLDISSWFEDEWVVLDKSRNVVDHGKDLEELWDRHERSSQKLTFYFASSLRP